MKCRKKVIAVCILACIILVAYVARFNYVNAQFPESKLCIVKAGEKAEKNGLKYSVISGDIMTGADYIEKYGDEDSFEVDDQVLIVYLDVENTTSETQKMGVSEMKAKCGLWANGVEYNSLWFVNEETFDDTIDSGKKERVGIAANINSNLKNIMKNGNEWRIEISGWPNRIELVVPMNGGKE